MMLSGQKRWNHFKTLVRNSSFWKEVHEKWQFQVKEKLIQYHMPLNKLLYSGSNRHRFQVLL